MDAMDAKYKMVSFRLSAGEYADAEQACRAYGYRSVSFFARCATLAFHTTASHSEAYEAQIRELRERVDTMAAELLRLAAQVRNGNAREQAGGAVMSSSRSPAPRV
jgi:hypothetical protein